MSVESSTLNAGSSASRGAVFLSYASQDAEAAKRICDALRAAGVEVWFDQNELVGGDAWDQKIRKQIRECALLIPIISKTTQARREAYFRLEWKLADERTHLMAKGTPFLLPVTIDETNDREALVPDAFLAIQWTKAPGGEVPAAFVARVKKLLEGEMEAGRPRPAEQRGSDFAKATTDKGGIPPPKKNLRSIRLPLVAGVIAIVTVAGAWFALRPAPVAPIANLKSQISNPPPPPATEFPHDPDLKRVYGMLYNVVDGIAEDFALMDDIVNPLLKARPNDPEVVTVAAELAQQYVTRGYDASPARRAQAQRLTERAFQLAPDNPEALAALGLYLASTGNQLGRAEELLRRAIQLKPTEPRFQCYLYVVLIKAKKPAAEIDAFGAQLAAMFPGYPMASYLIADHQASASNFAAAEEWVAKTLAIAPLPYAVLLKARLMLEVHGDVVGMERALEQMPERQRTSAALLNAYAVLATVTGQTGSARRVLEATADTWLVDGTYVFPRALLVGELEQIDGHADVARRQFEAAANEIKARLDAAPTDLWPIRAELWVQIALGHQEEARAALRTNLEKRPRPYRWSMGFNWWTGALRACLLLGERAEALGLLKEACAEAPGRLLLRNLFRVDPKMAPFRDDPAIVALLEEPAQVSVTAPASDKSVAVLAFADLSEKHDSEYFSDGISEELLNVLAKIPNLKVSARTSAFFFKGKDVPVPEIARQLGVAYVVEGSVRRQGDKVRITAQLIKAADGFHVWSDTFTRDLKDIFAVQDEIAGLVARNLQLTLAGSGQPRHEVNPEAHRLVLEARHFWNGRTMEGFNRAEAAARQAIALDSEFAQAHAMLAIVTVTRAVYRGYEGLADDGVPIARESAERALALDPGLVDAQAALGVVALIEGRLEESERIFRGAIASNPNQALPHHWFSLLLEATGRLDEALQEIGRAVELDPLSGVAIGTRGRYLAWAGRYEEALATFARATPLLPERPTLYGFPAECLLKSGRKDDAVAVARKVLTFAGKELRLVSDFDAIYVLQQTGHGREAAEFVNGFLQRYAPDSYQRGTMLVSLGRWEEAEPYLERTPWPMRYMFYWDPAWDAWRDDPRFHQLLAKLGCTKEYQVARETLARLQWEGRRNE